MKNVQECLMDVNDWMCHNRLKNYLDKAEFETTIESIPFLIYSCSMLLKSRMAMRNPERALLVINNVIQSIKCLEIMLDMTNIHLDVTFISIKKRLSHSVLADILIMQNISYIHYTTMFQTLMIFTFNNSKLFLDRVFVFLKTQHILFDNNKLLIKKGECMKKSDSV